MSDANYKIRYKKGDFEIEVQGDKAWVEEKFEEIKTEMPTKALPPAPSGSQTTTSTAVDKTLPTSLVEFVKSKGSPGEHTNRVVLFAYWLLKKENMSSYNITDMQNCYDETRSTKPGNISEVMNKVQARGFIMPVKEEKDGKKAWVITGTGEQYVEQMKG